MRSFLPSLLVPILLLLYAALPVSAAPVLSEFLAVNTAGIRDNEGNRQPWIEIVNNGNTTVNLGGYTLTNDPAVPAKYTIPANYNLQPGLYTIIFASGLNRAALGIPLHTNFTLSTTNYLSLRAPVASGGAIVSEYVNYPAQTANVSYGVVANYATAAQAAFHIPTPGAANNSDTLRAEKVDFSLSSRTFNQGSTLTLTLSTLSNLGTIRYTTDRTDPTDASTLYTGPITINYSVRIRARNFVAGAADSKVTGESYLMLDPAAQAFTSNLPIMILHNWGAGDPTTAAQAAGQPEDVKYGAWFIFEPKAPDNLARMTNLPDATNPAYFERRGSSTFGEFKYSMTMGALDEDAQGADASPLGFPSNDDWVMNAPYTYDKSLVHNDLIYRLSNELGRYAPRTKHFELFKSVINDTPAAGGLPAYGVINGAATSADYFGVYSFQEKISRGSKRVDVEKMGPEDNTAPNVQGGYLFKIDRFDVGDAGVGGGGRSVALVQPKEYATYPQHLLVATAQQKAYLTSVLNAMYASCTSPNFMNPATGYQSTLDVPAAIDHWILSIAPKSADAFRLSGYWYKPRFGKLVMGPIFDFDRAEGSIDGRDLNPNTWRGDNGDLGTDYFHNASIYSPNYFQYMFQDPNFWQALIDRYDEMRRGNFSTAHIGAIIDEYTELLDPGNAASTPAKRNFQKFGNSTRPAGAATPGTNSTWRGEMVWLKNWWTSRLNFMDNQFTRPPVSTPPPGPVAQGAQVVLTSPSQNLPGVKIYYTTDGTDPRPQATVPEPPAGQNTTIATILPETSVVRAIVPKAGTTVGGPTGIEWRGADLNSNGDNTDDFDDSTWFTNAANSINGVGYDNAPAIDYLPYINLRWNSATFPVAPSNDSNTMITSGAITGNQTCYIRWPFNVSAANQTLITTPGNKFVLRLRYDDGFVAWINGVELTNATVQVRANAPATNTLNNVSAATTTHDDAAAILYVDYDLTAFVSSVHAGNNILAIHGLNSGLASSDFLIQPTLVVQGPPAPYTPAIGANAIEYTGPITINGPTQIFSRTLNPVRPSDPPTANGGGTGSVPNGSAWSAPTKLVFFPGATSAGQANIKITEVLYHAPPPMPDELAAGYNADNDFEFIRLTNTGATPVDLTGVFFSSGVDFTAAPALQNLVQPGQSVVVVDNAAAFAYRYGTTFTILGSYHGDLDNSGEHIVLNDRNGAVISDFTYGDSTPWPAQADDGHSLIYVSGDQNVGGSWQASLDPGGTRVSNFSQWQRRYFSNSDVPFQPMSEDTDGDGINNLGEYALGTDPRNGGSGESSKGWITPGNPGSPPFFNLRRRAGITDATFIFETSTGLGTWTPSASGPVSTVDNGDGSETVKWQTPAPAPGARLFMRVRITNP
jgi:hypothetical protein